LNVSAGPAVITSSDPLPMEQWVTIVAELNNKDGSLVINDGIASKGLLQDCVIKTLAYVLHTGPHGNGGNRLRLML